MVDVYRITADVMTEMVKQDQEQRAEIERLRKRIVMLLRCHYDEHDHRGAPTCFDVQSPADEWESAAVVRAQASRGQ